MIYTSYEKTDDVYKFVGSNGEKMIVPISDVILVDDGSDLLSIKLIASRKTIGLVPKD